MYTHQEKLSAIMDVWRNYIYDCRFFESKFNLAEVTGNNYFGDLTTYFNDLESIIYEEEENNGDKNFIRDFKSAICFLQAIYVQQDFVKEMLLIFNCDEARKIIKNDSNFKINREIRNELVGHPIKREQSNRKTFESSAIFSNSNSANKIAYLRYHKENAFKSEHIVIKREDIINRHKNFINYYFDIVIQKLKEVLKDYRDKLQKLRDSLNDISFEILLKELKFNYNSIFNSERLFDFELLKEVFKKTELHIRYKFSIENFYKTLSEHLDETISILEGWLNWEIEDEKSNESIIEYPLFNDLDGDVDSLDGVQFVDFSTKGSTLNVDNNNYIISKLAMGNTDFAEVFKEQFADNRDVICELEHMEENLYNDSEYYSSFCYLCKLLGRE